VYVGNRADESLLTATLGFFMDETAKFVLDDLILPTVAAQVFGSYKADMHFTVANGRAIPKRWDAGEFESMLATRETREQIPTTYDSLPRKNYLAINGIIGIPEGSALPGRLSGWFLSAMEDATSPHAAMGSLETIMSVIVGADNQADKCQNHAEKKIADRANKEQETLFGVGASHRVCPSCQNAIWSGSPAAILFPLGSNLLCSFKDN